MHLVDMAGKNRLSFSTDDEFDAQDTLIISLPLWYFF